MSHCFYFVAPKKLKENRPSRYHNAYTGYNVIDFELHEFFSYLLLLVKVFFFAIPQREMSFQISPTKKMKRSSARMLITTKYQHRNVLIMKN